MFFSLKKVIKTRTDQFYNVFLCRFKYQLSELLAFQKQGSLVLPQPQSVHQQTRQQPQQMTKSWQQPKQQQNKTKEKTRKRTEEVCFSTKRKSRFSHGVTDILSNLSRLLLMFMFFLHLYMFLTEGRAPGSSVSPLTHLPADIPKWRACLRRFTPFIQYFAIGNTN